MVVRFVDIGAIDDHQCLNFLFITINLNSILFYLQQWFNMYASTRLELDRELLMGDGSDGQSKNTTIHLDVNKVFNKGKADKK